MSTSLNLWGNISNLEPTKTPISILKEQATVLREITGGLLVGAIEVERGDNYTIKATLVIIAPSLGDYRMPILNIESQLDPYPVKIYSEYLLNHSKESKNENDLLDQLKTIFQSDQVQRIISSLISQSKAL